MVKNFRDLLEREFSPYGSLSGEQIHLLEQHYALLLRWNTKLNLTRIESVEDAVRFHYCESLFLGTRLPVGPLSVVDVGSGAGFPGIPMAILRPECSVTLVESHQRKAVFLKEATRGSSNVTVVTDRAENLRSKFDWLVSRAVNPLSVRKLNYSNNLALLVGEDDSREFTRREALPWGASRYVVFDLDRHANI